MKLTKAEELKELDDKYIKGHEFTLSLKTWTGTDGPIWVCKCREYDIVTQGDTMGEAAIRFLASLNGHIRISLENGEKPFERIKK